MSAQIGSLQHLRVWVKRRDGYLARALYHLARGVRRLEIPMFRPLHGTLYALHRIVSASFADLIRVLYWTPLFKSRLAGPATNLYVYAGMPLVSGPLEIFFGSDCRVSGHTTFSGRSAGAKTPRLSVGSNVDIGWQTTIAVGSRVVIGDNVRIAGRGFFAGYPGHPLDAKSRALGLPDTDAQVGDIVLENDVWLATGVMVMAGVRIGQGSVVAAGSVVTRDIPAGVLAAGNPARVLRSLDDDTAGERATHAR
ncbi:MAG: acyltransferase [Gammaproteobacteria bacterium]|nr:acyltransferase [Gammaproteobacteria bacterium]MDX2459139.1 acyltransferase [Gammaproteobacteria bacterium]